VGDGRGAASPLAPRVSSVSEPPPPTSLGAAAGRACRLVGGGRGPSARCTDAALVAGPDAGSHPCKLWVLEQFGKTFITGF